MNTHTSGRSPHGRRRRGAAHRSQIGRSRVPAHRRRARTPVRGGRVNQLLLNRTRF